MKIFVVTGIFPPESGGPATYVPAFATECVRRGHRVTVVTYGASRKKAGYPYRVVSVPRFFLPIRYGLFFLACLRYGFSADVFFMQDAFSAGIPAFFTAIVLRKRIAVKIVGDFSWEYARNTGATEDGIGAFQNRTAYPFVAGFIRFFQCMICRHSDNIIVPSEYLKTVVAGWGVDPARISVVYNAVTVPHQPVPRSRPPRLFFSAGRLVPWKNFTGIVRAFALVRRAYPEARLVIAGDGPCRPAIGECVRAHGLTDAVSLIGNVPPETMARMYAESSCFVLFSSYEGCSHAILEALACGLPVIASDAGGNGELIAHSINGMLVPSGDEAALAGAMESFLIDPHAAVPRPGFSEDGRFEWFSLMEKTLSALEKNPLP